MAGTYLDIPGNIKQRSLPFVLDPSNSINTAMIAVADKDGTSKQNNGAGETQLFSYKPEEFGSGENCAAEKSGFLRIAPASFYYENDGSKTTYSAPNSDLSYKLIYGNELAGDGGTKQLNGIGVLNSIPSVTVREYLQDSKLNNVINLFQSVIGGWDQGTKMAEAAKTDKLKSFSDKLWNFTKAVMANLPGILKDSADGTSAIKNLQVDTDYADDYVYYVDKIPYALYYSMISTTSTNIYQLPWSGKVMYTSDGTQGWNRDNGIGDMMVDGKSIGGKIFNYMFGNIKVNTTPTWTPKDASQPVKMEFTVDLYNDTLEGALKNFIFINTIVPGNKFLQYHIYQHAPNLYDVRIDGIMRLFMCAATFKVDAVGVLRTPSRDFLTTLASKHSNKYSISNAYDLCKYIRIPDIYRVTLAFESLLPDSFNNYIYQYYINQPIKTLKDTNLRTPSLYEDFSKKIVENVAKMWGSAGSDGDSGDGGDSGTESAISKKSF